MSFRRSELPGFRWAWAAWILCSAFEVRAQSPVSGESVANPRFLKGSQDPTDLVCQRASFCTVLWSFGEFSSGERPVFLRQRLAATSIGPDGGVLKDLVYGENPFLDYPQAVPVGARFALFWGTDPRFQWFDRNLEPQGTANSLVLLPGFRRALRAVARTPAGFVQLWSATDVQSPTASDGAFLVFLDEAGRQLRPPLRVHAGVVGEQRAWPGGLAVDPAGGVITVVYEQFFRSDAEPQTDVYYRRFSLAGEPLSADTRMNSHLSDWQIYPSVAVQPGGGFVATWTSDGQDGSYRGIFGRRFDATGAPVGAEFQVNQVTFSDQIVSRVASDAAGDFVVAWKSFDPSSFGINQWDIKARLYRADGRPVGPEIYVNQERELEQENQQVAFASNGTFQVAWSSNAQIPPYNENTHDVFTRRFSASRADEPCLLGDGAFRCDTGRTGGAPEVVHAFGGPAARQGLLGDIDGDGREDPCVYSAANFRCDADHEGGLAEVRIRFTVDGATTPLLGDVDGDGRADPCLYGGGRLSCDTRHDGGTPELRLSFGKRDEIPLLGDVDGDGRADACAWADGLFRCDTRHDGGSAEWSVRFGQRGDQPLLGDFDGDGRDDPCIYRQGTLLCDSAHDGGAAEGTLAFGAPGDRLVLGNLDGL